jgi:type IV secretion system protein VirB1
MDFVNLVQECAPWASPQTMAAIVRRESGFNTLSIGINGGAKLARQPTFKQEAVVTAKWLIEHGYNIDMGLAQINVKNLVKLNLSVDDVFDGCKNIAAAATLLSWNYQSAKGKIAGEQQALLSAISMYNTGNTSSGFSNGYVNGVVANAAKAIPTTAIFPDGVAATVYAPKARTTAFAQRFQSGATAQQMQETSFNEVAARNYTFSSKAQ